MTKKDQMEIKKVVGNTYHTPINRIAGCYIRSSDKYMVCQKPCFIESLTEEEQEVYCRHFAKALSGKPGSTAIELRNSKTEFLDRLLTSELKDNEAVKELFGMINNEYSSREDYCILLACGTYDIPSSETDEVYSFLLITIHSCPLSKPGLIIDLQKGSFVDRVKDHALQTPSFSFLYPSFEERKIDLEHFIYSMKTSKKIGEMDRVIQELFGTILPPAEEIQKEGIQDIFQAGFKNGIPFSALQMFYGHMAGRKLDEEISGKVMCLSANEIADVIIKECGIKEEYIQAVREKALEYSNVHFYTAVAAPEKITIKTETADIVVHLNEIGNIQKQVVNGGEYYMIPARNIFIDQMHIVE